MNRLLFISITPYKSHEAHYPNSNMDLCGGLLKSNNTINLLIIVRLIRFSFRY